MSAYASRATAVVGGTWHILGDEAHSTNFRMTSPCLETGTWHKLCVDRRSTAHASPTWSTARLLIGFSRIDAGRSKFPIRWEPTLARDLAPWFLSSSVLHWLSVQPKTVFKSLNWLQPIECISVLIPSRRWYIPKGNLLILDVSDA